MKKTRARDGVYYFIKEQGLKHKIKDWFVIMFELKRTAA